MNWTYKGEPVTELPEGKIGFVYVTHYTDGSFYIGKKLCLTKRKRKPLVGMRKNARRMVEVELKWKDYEGSSSIKDSYELASKEIVAWCNTKKAMSYIETDLQFRSGALFDEKCLNLNIAGTYFTGVLDGEDSIH